MGFANEIKTGEFEREGSTGRFGNTGSSKTRPYVIGIFRGRVE